MSYFGDKISMFSKQNLNVYEIMNFRASSTIALAQLFLWRENKIRS